MKDEERRTKYERGTGKGLSVLRASYFVLLTSSFALSSEPTPDDAMAVVEALEGTLQRTIQRVLPSVVTVGRERLNVDDAADQRVEALRAGIHPSWLGIRVRAGAEASRLPAAGVVLNGRWVQHRASPTGRNQLVSF